MTNDPSGSPVAHGGNPQDRTGSPMTNDIQLLTNQSLSQKLSLGAYTFSDECAKLLTRG
ncbi:MAG: hypothetical protein V7K64_18850 [Nostoc sp.]|uniref:hypothetical protein n=1 Tax=unclassified Nostoc TaxID=2593658 RepID=UPI001D52F737|nr:hypothetical protein [Nostoc sp. JL34]MBN3886506.1 hypothetical protein [Nostoc sp. JL34]